MTPLRDTSKLAALFESSGNHETITDSNRHLRKSIARFEKCSSPDTVLSVLMLNAVKQVPDMLKEIEAQMLNDAPDLEAIESGEGRISPEDFMYRRITGVATGINGLGVLMQNGPYKQHRKQMPGVFRFIPPADMAPAQQSLYANALEIMYKPVDLQRLYRLEPDWYGLPLDEIANRLQKRDNQDRGHKGADKQFDSNKQALSELTTVADTWEKSSPARLSVRWGYMVDDAFIPADTQLLVNVKYTQKNGFVCRPDLYIQPYAIESKEPVLTAKGKPFSFLKLKNSSDEELNNSITDKFNI